MAEHMIKVEKWDIFEEKFKGPQKGNPFIDVSLVAVFKHEKSKIEVEGFYDGDGIYKIRMMPEYEGEWSYTTTSNYPELDKIEGQFNVIKASNNNHGIIKVHNTYHFVYTDGTLYYPMGTTCYAWIYQNDKLQERTLQTLKNAAFNKIRMCVFPKHYDYNHNEPSRYPFEGSLESGFDFTRFKPEFFRHLEMRILELQKLGIECDLILFHPYDRWGFCDMGRENDDRYVRYVIARLAAFRNIWWSVANEFDLMVSKKEKDWDRFFHIMQRYDAYQHLKSIHNCKKIYDHSKPWITHCSLQAQEPYKIKNYMEKWRTVSKKPVVIDECAYEGNINHGWGNISGQEMTRRFWEGTLRGAYVGHGETYMHPEEILWWSHGGELYGTSPTRIAFLKKVLEEGPEEGLSPIKYAWDVLCGGVEGKYYIFYFGLNRPSFVEFKLPDGIKYKVQIIDTWEMTINELRGIFQGDFKINMPGKEYIAVRAISIE